MPSCCKTLYMWIMQCYLVARHYVCELCNAMLFRQAPYMWIISCRPFFYFSLLFSTMFVYSTALPVHQPFELLMEKSGLKTRSSEQTMLLAEADILLVTDSYSEEDSEADDQSYYPLRCMLKLGRVILLISCICYIAMLSFYIIYTILNAISLVDTSYMRLPSAHFLSI